MESVLVKSFDPVHNCVDECESDSDAVDVAQSSTETFLLVNSKQGIVPIEVGRHVCPLITLLQLVMIPVGRLATSIEAVDEVV